MGGILFVLLLLFISGILSIFLTWIFCRRSKFNQNHVGMEPESILSESFLSNEADNIRKMANDLITRKGHETFYLTFLDMISFLYYDGVDKDTFVYRKGKLKIIQTYEVLKRREYTTIYWGKEAVFFKCMGHSGR